MQNLFEYTDGLNHPMEAFHHVLCPGNFPILPHWHYFIEIIYMLEGSIEATCADAVYGLHTGDLIIFCPQKVHALDILYDPTISYGLNPQKTASQCRLYEDAPVPKINAQHNAIYPISNTETTVSGNIRYEVLKFDLNFLNANNRFKTNFSKTLVRAFETDPGNIYFSADALQQYPIADWMASCIDEMSTQQYGYDIAAGSVTSMLLTTLLRIWLRNGVKPNDTAHQLAVGSRAFEEITQYIDHHCSEALQVQDLAAHCNMSYSYFAKLFRQTYNQSCKEYIEFIRINKVMDLLRFTDLDLTYISQETGFADCSHLIRTFKKHKGTTPKQWRKENRYY